MSVSEIAIVAGSAAVGIAVGATVTYFSAKRNSGSSENSKERGSSAPRGNNSSASIASDNRGQSAIPREHLEKSRKELRTLLLEKELVSAALTRLYEAEVAKEITREERELLGAKYKTELESLDERISKIDALIQIGDLETLRDQLMKLVNQKMDAIDKRIESTRLLAAPLIAQMTKASEAQHPKTEATQKSKVPDISDLLGANSQSPVPVSQLPQLETPIPVPAGVSTGAAQSEIKKRTGSTDGQAEELQKELLEALDRLSKLDVEA